MAHDLHNNSAYAGRQPAWHGLGQVLPQAETMRELADAAGITFTYETTPLFFERETAGGETWHHQFVGKNAVTLNGEVPLAVVGDDYELVQPAEIIQSLDAIISGTGWKPETALALGRGETTAFCVALGDWFISGNGTQDRLEDYLLVTDTVDGKHSLCVSIVPVRTVCRNTLRIGLRQASVRLNLVHKRGHKNAYGRAVDEIIKSQNHVREALTNLSRIQYTADKARELFAKVFDHRIDGETTQAQALRRRMLELRQHADGYLMRMVKDEGQAMSGWTAYNAVSETVEHSGQFGGPTGTRRSLLLGNGPAMQTLTRAFELIVARQ